MTGGRRYGFDGKEDIGGGGFRLNFGCRGGYFLELSLGLDIGSLGVIKGSLMVDEKSRILARPNEDHEIDHEILTGLAGQTVQWNADIVLVMME